VFRCAIVNPPPPIERKLTRHQIGKAVAIENLRLQRPVETLLFSLRLRMVGTPVAHPNAMAHQPDREGGERLAIPVTPWRAVVHQHRKWQSVAAEQRRQALAHRCVLLVVAGLQPQRIARVIVQHGERMAAPHRQREMPLEVHLPQLVRFSAFKPDMRTRMLRRAVQLAVPAQHLRDRAQRRHRMPALARQRPGDLAGAPRIVARRTDAQHRRRRRLVGPQRARVRTPRAIDQTNITRQSMPTQPFVAGLPADTEITAQTASVRSDRRRKTNERFPLLHHRQLPHRHRVFLSPAMSQP
jgi:hypothetical protein